MENQEAGQAIPLTRILIGVFLASVSLLAFEIALTRLLSVLLSYHFVFAVLSLALMGQGLGALYLAAARRLPAGPADGARRLSARTFQLAFSIAVSASLMILASLTTPLAPVYLALSFPPFFLGGIFFADVFRSFSKHSAAIYAADLMGAGAGCAGVVGLLQLVSATQSLYAIALIACCSALVLGSASWKLPPTRSSTLFSVRWMRGRTAMICLTLILLFIASFRIDRLKTIPVGGNPEKEIADALSFGKIEKTLSSAFGQTDLIRYPDTPGRKDMYIDGTAGTPMYRFTGDILAPGPDVSRLLLEFPGYFPLTFLTDNEKDRCLIIGPGGGRDVLLALAAGFRDIEAVDVNQDFVDLVISHADYNGGIYSANDSVHIRVDEGRSFLKRQDRLYDLIMMSLPATNSSRSRQGFALTENFLLTCEAIEDYLSHLTAEGRLLVVTHGEVEALRLLSVILETLEKQEIGTQAAMGQIVLVGHEDYPVLVLHKAPVDRERVRDMVTRLSVRGYDPMGSYFPFAVRPGAVNPALAGLAAGHHTMAQVREWAARQGHDISPVHDNRPYFFKFKPGVPDAVIWVLGSGSALLVLILAVMKRIYPIAGGIPGKPGASGRRLSCLSILFTGLGSGFMVVEISLAQQCFLFIGHPVLSISAILFALLIGAGLGGMVSHRRPMANVSGSIASNLIIIVVVLSLSMVLLPEIFRRLLGFSLLVRLTTTVTAMGVVGFVMGFPFPLALRLMRHLGLEQWIPWMLGLNGISSVLGSALCVAIATALGSAQALGSGICLYAVCFCCLLLSRSCLKA